MDDLAELSDASRTGLRYLQRNNSTATRAQRPQSHALVSPNASPDVSRQSPNMNPDILSPRTLSVHSQREIPSILPASERMKDNFLSTTFQTTSMGRECYIVANVILGSERRSEQRKFALEFDLGSSLCWVYGSELQVPDNPRHPKGTPDSRPKFWSYSPEGTNRALNDELHHLAYADGSTVSYKLWEDYMHFVPDKTLAQGSPKPMLMVMFGVAEEVSIDFETFPASGILGLGRKQGADRAQPTFLAQIMDYLETPEVEIIFGPRNGTVTFGERQKLPDDDADLARGIQISQWLATTGQWQAK
ncbi:hypothetical protein B0H10DRAFT_815032 [Mycena sp. CBHHK59/15]|nr:hypothetical protein B0H10DRAFT_815032 [Mycena sp. CBHHK59/15]